MSVSTSRTGSRSTSRSLLARVRANDAAAWNHLVELYAPYVFVQCRRARLAHEDTADIFQEVFQSAFAKLDGFKKERPGDTFRGWLSTITRNKVRDHFRRVEREPKAVGGSQIRARIAQQQAPEPESDLESVDAPPTIPDPERELFQRALEAVRPALPRSHLARVRSDRPRGPLPEGRRR